MFVCIPKRAAHRAAAGILCAALAVCGAALALRAHAQGQEAVAAASYEWGLSFQEENQPPVPNLTAEQLRPYDAYYCGDTGQKRLYLTFDAGYENGNMPAILDALKKHGAPGAFFVDVYKRQRHTHARPSTRCAGGICGSSGRPPRRRGAARPRPGGQRRRTRP